MADNLALDKDIAASEAAATTRHAAAAAARGIRMAFNA